MEDVEVICLGWLQLRLLKFKKYQARNRRKCTILSPNMLLFLFFRPVFVKFTLFNSVETAYLSKTVREADSLSSVQSVNLITTFSSNESLQYPRDEGGLLVPHLCIPSRLPLKMLHVITKIRGESECVLERYRQTFLFV